MCFGGLTCFFSLFFPAIVISHILWNEPVASYKELTETNNICWTLTRIPCRVGSCGVVPYMLCSSRVVKAMLTRCHCATKASWWRHVEHISCSVFHSDGAGKQCAHDRIQTSNSTVSMRSHSKLPMESISKKSKWCSHIMLPLLLPTDKVCQLLPIILTLNRTDCPK